MKKKEIPRFIALKRTTERNRTRIRFECGPFRGWLYVRHRLDCFENKVWEIHAVWYLLIPAESAIGPLVINAKFSGKAEAIAAIEALVGELYAWKRGAE